MEAKVTAEDAKRKAVLLAGGPVLLPAGFGIPFPPSRSTAGPGAGQKEIVFSFGGTRAKKAVSRVSGEFELVESCKGLAIMRDGKPFIGLVELQPTLLHAPFQAFVNVDSRCSLRCAFCNSHRLPAHATKGLTDDKIVDMITKAEETGELKGIALTSGVPGSPEETVERLVNLIERIRARFPEQPIGTEPYLTHPRQVDALRKAGADEIKINIESFDPDIFDRICPGRDYAEILHCINHAGKVFGWNQVCSNIIFGLGESDDVVVQGIKTLANMGAVATLRALRRNDLNSEPLSEALGGAPTPVTADRMLRLSAEHKKVLTDYELTPLRFRTMCHACLACDLVPFWDV